MRPIILIHLLGFIELKWDVAYLENVKQSDPVRPGEQWFFYWKTSASLWEGRIAQFPQDEVIFIPVFWGFHGDSGTAWDFGHDRPERDLLRLTQLLTQHGRTFCWVLPLTPAPFFPNGGVPVYSARTLSISKEGVHHAILDQEHHLHKMFSFFEPKVYEAWAAFLKSFGQFLSQHKFKAPVWGAQFYYSQGGEVTSYLEDYSFAFEQGFSRFLKQNHPEGTDLSDPKIEGELKIEFREEVGKLFSATAEGTLSPFWAGTQKIMVLGGSPKETILRSLPSGKSQLEYTRDIFHCYTNSAWISSALLTQAEKKDTLSWILSEHFGNREVAQRYGYQFQDRDPASEFKPYSLISLPPILKERDFITI
jgi:hypothetical protein